MESKDGTPKLKLMKRIPLFFAALCLAALAIAQTPEGQRPPAPSQEEMIERATKDLSLSEEQVKEWKTIHKKYAEALEQEKQVHETRKQMGEELEATLTKEQLVKFEEMRKKQGPPRPEGGRKR